MYRTLLVLSLLFVGCSQTGTQSEQFDAAAWEARGAEALQPLKSSLQSALLEALADGPESAIAVCRELAPRLTSDASVGGVEVGRTSHKLRNPDNAPREWMLPLLTSYVASPGDTTPRVVELDGGGVGYAEPIYVKALCLGCHGSQLAPSVAETIAELYPQDQAKGFEKGDFRGLFWVEFAASE